MGDYPKTCYTLVIKRILSLIFISRVMAYAFFNVDGRSNPLESPAIIAIVMFTDAYPQTSHDIISLIDQLPNVTTLILSGNRIVFDVLPHVSKLSCSILEIRESNRDGALHIPHGVKTLQLGPRSSVTKLAGNYRELTSLSISCLDISNLDMIQSLDSLQALALNYVTYVSELAHLPASLRSLSLTSSSRIVAITYPPALEELAVFDDGLVSTRLFLSHVPDSIKILSLSGWRGRYYMPELGPQSKLTSLTLEGGRAKLMPMHLRAIRYLNLYCCSLSVDPFYERLYFDNVMIAGTRYMPINWFVAMIDECSPTIYKLNPYAIMNRTSTFEYASYISPGTIRRLHPVLVLAWFLTHATRLFRVSLPVVNLLYRIYTSKENENYILKQYTTCFNIN